MTTPVSQKPGNTLTLEQIENNLLHVQVGFPTEAVEAAITNQEAITPKLLAILNNALDDVCCVQDRDIGHMFALFLLSQFREKNAFESIIRLARLSEEELDYLIDDCITDDLHRFIASTYNGDLSAIKNLIEDTDVNLWSRIAALESLVILVHEGELAFEEIAQYLSSLFSKKSVSEGEHLISYLVTACCDLNPHHFRNNIENAFKKKKVDPHVMDITIYKQILASPTLQHTDSDSSLITNTIAEMEDWVCFKNPEDNDDEEELLSSEWLESLTAPVATTHVNKTPKTGRNDPCPCNSGKKYKQCCLSKQV